MRGRSGQFAKSVVCQTRHVGDYFAYWPKLGAAADLAKLPKILRSTGSAAAPTAASCCPGFGDNVRVLQWALERLDGAADAVETPIGFVPTADALDLTGVSERARRLATAALAVDIDWSLTQARAAELVLFLSDQASSEYDHGVTGDVLPNRKPWLKIRNTFRRSWHYPAECAASSHRIFNAANCARAREAMNQERT